LQLKSNVFNYRLNWQLSNFNIILLLKFVKSNYNNLLFLMSVSIFKLLKTRIDGCATLFTHPMIRYEEINRFY